MSIEKVMPVRYMTLPDLLWQFSVDKDGYARHLGFVKSNIHV